MIFRVYEHYDDNEYENIVSECFICYDSSDILELISLKSQPYYHKNCNCDGDIHKNCLDTWFMKQNKCPICRMVITKNDNNINIVQLITIVDKKLSFVLSRLSNTIMYIILCYISLEFYIYCATKKHLSRSKDE